jgi:tripartite-type tricarboxylate transporter receptor subunit TctC
MSIKEGRSPIDWSGGTAVNGPLMSRRRTALTGAAAAAISLLAPSHRARAQDGWPQRVIRIIVPFGAGSGTDIMARFYAERLGRKLGQSIVVENLAGANGAIGARAAARATPDGYTIFFGSVSTHAANPHLLREPGYDPVRDFEPLSLITINAVVLTVNASFPAQNLQEFLAYGRARPGQLNFGSGNAGGLGAMYLLTSAAGVQVETINYRGTPAAITDLISGRVHFVMTDSGPLLPHLKVGTLRALAVSTEQRIELLPDVPTIREAAIPDYQFDNWSAMWVPAGTPQPIVERLNREIVTIADSPEGKEFMAGIGLTSRGSTPEELAALMARSSAQWARIVEGTGMPRQ